MIKELQNALSHVLLGKDEVIRLGITCLLANGHLLLEDIPGMGKTTFSHALAHFVGMKYRRIQFTSDMLPGDLLGVSIFDPEQQQFHFHYGPIFSQLILADEVNRATPRTQSALLEAMEERQVTTEEGTHLLPNPFFVIATQNPSHQTGTYLLPESQLDRFLMCLTIGYPPPDAERKLLTLPGNDNLFDRPPVSNVDQLITWQRESLLVHVSDPVLDYIQEILAASRQQDWFYHGLSPRAGMALVKASKAYARTDDRDFVRPDDVQAIMAAVVNHRLVIKQANVPYSATDLLLNHVEVPL
ncbi:AAA family ATPase [Legionella spiritensis]|uniref:Methanol dehydrogenase regulatory protein n=1 Tax=Legionella spiritensis TaxID=452 RepID=A0A0W0Z8U7_LEGSP|nr:MoxR family ATPase [Legionella spiritensis]KTD65532.1 methanol dehydrogenase regulatory protein [Legionella spiritensis]SNV44641.1 methanol dehydrogenase regulatory protein [Legionella spiritensis]VEG90841.1 methanol dehydrogenase regulatory protein [Legionella spiritensis]